jgi:L-ascorbate metabolism protein UlaG (beta-lactamase superfamily)
MKALKICALALALGTLSGPAAARTWDTDNVGFIRNDRACRADELVSTGGAAPKHKNVLAIRWTGYSNFELVHNGKVILLDAYFDRGSWHPPIGVAAADIRKVDLMIIGHGHFDHMSDAASIGLRTGAPILGGPPTIDKLLTQSVPASQLRLTRGLTAQGLGEVLHFDGFTVEAILGVHGAPPASITGPINAALAQVTTPLTPGQAAESAIINSRGTSVGVNNIGTIAYLITFDNGFKVMYRDSGGVISEHETAAMRRIGAVDVALAATSASFLNGITGDRALDYLRAYKPDVFIPAHHDAAQTSLWRATEPLAQAIHDENPDVLFVSKSYRLPVCFDTSRNIARRNQNTRNENDDNSYDR